MNPESAATKVIESGAFGALCIVLLLFIWWLVRESSRKDAEHTTQVKEMGIAHTRQIQDINDKHDVTIEKLNAQYLAQIDKMNNQAMLERKESIEAFNKISASLSILNQSIEKRGRVEFRDEQRT